MDAHHLQSDLSAYTLYFPCYQHFAWISRSFLKRHNACFRLMWKLKSTVSQRRCSMKSITQEKSKLGFIGVGYMGRPIARRLLESGFKLTTYDRNPGKAAELVRYSGSVAQSVSELLSGCDVILSCLPNDEAVLDT